MLKLGYTFLFHSLFYQNFRFGRFGCDELYESRLLFSWILSPIDNCLHSPLHIELFWHITRYGDVKIPFSTALHSGWWRRFCITRVEKGLSIASLHDYLQSIFVDLIAEVAKKIQTQRELNLQSYCSLQGKRFVICPIVLLLSLMRRNNFLIYVEWYI